MKIKDIIDESFDSIIPKELVKSTPHQYVISGIIGNRKIIFHASRSQESHPDEGYRDVWSIDFYEDNGGTADYEKTGSGNEMQVFAFIIDCIRDLIQKHSPDVITFTSDKNEGNRSRLYQRLSRRIKIPGYRFAGADDESSNYEDQFVFVKDKY
jgi:hypothetical protein